MTDITNALARFWSKVDVPDECWIWTDSKMTEGHGLFNSGVFAGKSAHRFAYMAFVGPIPDGYTVDHMCHQPNCVNPNHLQAVTPSENQQNRKGANRNNRSGYRNVTWSSRSQRWTVLVEVGGRRYRGGTFDDVEEANRAAIALRSQVMTNNLTDRAERKAS